MTNSMRVSPEPRKLKVFFSQPMHGGQNSDLYNRLKEFKEDLMFLLENASSTWYIANDILLIGEADLVCFAHDWGSASGCRIEWEVVRKFKIPHMVMPKQMYY